MRRERYTYRAHGFTIDSALDLPPLTRGDGDADVRIELGAVPAHLEGGIAGGRRYETAKGEYLLDLRAVARFWVRDGRDVQIDIAPGADLDVVRSYVLSSVMAALAHQRGRLALHAAAVDIDGASVLFAGAKGAGKSSLAAAFLEAGYRVLSDDVSVVFFDDEGLPFAHPGYAQVKLRPDSYERVGAALGTAVRPSRLSKYVVRIDAPAAVPLPVSRMYLLTWEAAAAISIEPVTGSAKVAALVESTYRLRMMAALDAGSAHFAQCVRLAQRIPILRIERPRDLNRLGELVRAIAHDVRSGV